MRDEGKTRAQLVAELADLRREVEKQLQESEAEHRRLLENLPVAIASTTPKCGTGTPCPSTWLFARSPASPGARCATIWWP